jgi:hypothetical protein
MTPLDKLARDICWIGFPNKKLVGRTKAQHWKNLPEETRHEYRKEAQHFVWIYDNIDLRLLGPLSFRVED